MTAAEVRVRASKRLASRFPCPSVPLLGVTLCACAPAVAAARSNNHPGSADALWRPGRAVVEDGAIERALRATFHDDVRLHDRAPQIFVRGGVIRLSGVVDSLPSRAAAEEDATHVRGVRRVDDQVVITPEAPPSDAVILQNVETALRTDGFLPDASGIRVSVTSGKVSLTGIVDSAFERFPAVSDASSVPGVREVDAQIQVRTEYGRKLERRVVDALFWDPRVGEGARVREYEDDSVILTGSVHTPAEAIAAVEDARRAGARYVVDEIDVRASASARP